MVSALRNIGCRLSQHPGQFLVDNVGMRFSGLFRSSLANEESRVLALVWKSVRTIVVVTMVKK